MMNLLNILLQVTQTIADTTAIVQSAAPAATSTAPELTFWYLIKEGGPLMIPLAICSLIGLFIFIERYLAIRRYGNAPDDFVAQLKPMIQKGQFQKAQDYCARYDNSLARVISKGIARIGKPFDVIESSMENVGARELYKMENRVGILATIADIAPMFGFLGTIAGMIILFYNVNTHGFSLESISAGIYTKMVTSAVGLIIGVLAYMGYKFLMARIDRNVNKMEIQSSDFIDCLYEPELY